MKPRIIQSGIRLKRHPIAALLLSLVCPGLGQLYNGRPSRGAAFLAGIVMLSLSPPAYTATRAAAGRTAVFAAMLFCAAAVWIASFAEAAWSAARNRDISPAPFHRACVYALYSISCWIACACSIAIVASFFSLHRVEGDSMKPSLRAGEIALINHYGARDPGRGDAVLYHAGGENRTGRIIAKAGDRVRYDANTIIVNDVPLSLGVLSDSEVSRTGEADTDNLYYETSGNVRYPVLFGFRETPPMLGKKESILVEPGRLLVAHDNRLKGFAYDVIPALSVTGRIEGIAFSRIKSRLFAPAAL